MDIYEQCGNHICSVIYASYVHSASCHKADCSDFIYGTYICVNLPYKPIRYLIYVAYMPNFMGIFVSSTCLVITCEVYIAVGCVLEHICINVGSICLSSMLAV